MSRKLKRTLPCFASSLSDGNMEMLENIITDKYEEFLGIFWMLESRYDMIKSLKCKGMTKNELDITVTCNVPEESLSIYDEITRMTRDTDIYSVITQRENNKLRITLIRQ